MKNGALHTPTPFEKGRSRLRVTGCRLRHLAIAWPLGAPCGAAAVPLLRGVRGMKNRALHTPSPFEKGGALGCGSQVAAFSNCTVVRSALLCGSRSPLERG